MTHVATGFPDLDAETGGFPRGALTVVVGDRSSGKTTLALNLLRLACVEAGGNARGLFFTLEMPAANAVENLASSIAGVRPRDARSGLLWTDELARLVAAREAVARAPIAVDDRALPPLGQVLAAMRAERGVDLVVLDYVQLVGGDDGSAAEPHEALVQLDAVAREQDVAVVVFSQLNEEVVSAPEPALVLVLEHEEGTASALVVARSRRGPSGRRIPLVFTAQTMRFDAVGA